MTHMAGNLLQLTAKVPFLHGSAWQAPSGDRHFFAVT